MTIERLWIILIKRWMLTVICLVVVGLGAYIGSKFITPLYQSTVLIQVALQAQNQSDVNSLLASDQLVQTESQLAVSYPILQAVASHHSGLTADQLAKEATSTPRLNTQLFEIDVQNSSPTEAAALANDIAATLIAQELETSQQNYATAIQQIRTDLNNTQQQINSDTTNLGQLQAEVQALLRQDPQQVKQEATLQAQINALQTQLNNLQQHYNDRQAVLAQLQLTETQNSNFLRVVQAAQPAVTPVSPQVMFNTGAGLVAGMLLGILLAILIEQLDTRISTLEDITELLSWPTLATVNLAKTSNKEEMINPNGRDINAESYRILRTNIGFASIDKPLQSLVVTSALPRDGKSMVAANLAIFMARTGKNTLLIDADLHRPTQHTLFNLPADRMGLSNAVLAFSSLNMSKPNTPSGLQFQNPTLQPRNSVMTDTVLLGSFVHAVGIPNLRVMPTGQLPPNPSELLDSKAMLRFLSVIANCGVEVAIFDTPPLLGLSDASILASKVDGVLAVIDMTRATKGKLKQLKAALVQTGANVLGCVANKHRRNRNDSTYSYYYYQMQGQDGKERSFAPLSMTDGGGTSLGAINRAPTPLSQFERGRKFN